MTSGSTLSTWSKRGVAVRRLGDREALVPQQRAQHAPDVGFIVHQEDLGRCCAHRLGRFTTNVAPPPGVDSTSIVPPCSSTVCRTSARPSPVPPGLPV